MTLLEVLSFGVVAGVTEPLPPLQISNNLADAILVAIRIWLRTMFESMLNGLALPLVEFLIIPPPTQPPMKALWEKSARAALALLPLMVTLGLLTMPWADKEKASPWRMGFRFVTVLLLIAISDPVLSLLIDVGNDLTVFLAPNDYRIAHSPASLNSYGWASGTSDVLRTFLLGILAVEMLLAVILGALALSLRLFIVYYVFAAAPILAALWYPNWSVGKSISKFAAKQARMGLFAVLSGPVIALILAVGEKVIEGTLLLSEDAGTAGGIGRFWMNISLTILIPFIVVFAVVKMLKKAGEPIGIGSAYSGAVTAFATLAGAAAGAGADSVIGAGAGSAAGGAGAKLAGKGAQKGAQAGTGAVGGASGGGGPGTLGGGGGGTGDGDQSRASRAGMDVEHQTVADTMDGDVSTAGEGVGTSGAEAQDKFAFLRNRNEESSINAQAAHDLELTEEEPAKPWQDVDVNEEGEFSYETVDGDEATGNVKEGAIGYSAAAFSRSDGIPEDKAQADGTYGWDPTTPSELLGSAVSRPAGYVSGAAGNFNNWATSTDTGQSLGIDRVSSSVGKTASTAKQKFTPDGDPTGILELVGEAKDTLDGWEKDATKEVGKAKNERVHQANKYRMVSKPADAGKWVAGKTAAAGKKTVGIGSTVKPYTKDTGKWALRTQKKALKAGAVASLYGMTPQPFAVYAGMRAVDDDTAPLETDDQEKQPRARNTSTVYNDSPRQTNGGSVNSSSQSTISAGDVTSGSVRAGNRYNLEGPVKIDEVEKEQSLQDRDEVIQVAKGTQVDSGESIPLVNRVDESSETNSLSEGDQISADRAKAISRPADQDPVHDFVDQDSGEYMQVEFDDQTEIRDNS